MKKQHCLIIIVILFYVSISRAFNCKRIPFKADPPKANINKYIIEIADNPSEYSPGQTYKLYLKSSPSNPITSYFTKFMLVAEPESFLEGSQDIATGDLSPVDHSIARFTPECPNAIIQTNNLAKSNVEVLWTAPPSGNGCIAIKATVFESSDSWFTEDGELTKILCEEKENKDVQSPALEKCCACNEAKYEIAFQGMWTRNTHPNDYPANMWATKLGELIGASHRYTKAFWSYNGTASEGLKLLAEEGDTTVLEDELKELVKNDDIRTIIKARELSYPNITGTSYTVFRVDQDHHLISVVSKITPSPDWIVGVADMELCTPNCKWLPSRTLNLYPWDVGTDDGTSYNSADSPLETSKTIMRITSESEEHVPFYNKNGEPIKPIAQLRVTRQKIYEKVCEEEEEEDPCALGEWSEWSSCSTTCGNEVRTRDRPLLKPENIDECSKNGLELQETERCETTEDCEPSKCAAASWSEWSPCSATCGTGVKTRYGQLPSSEENKEVEDEVPCEESVECTMPSCEDEETTNALSSESQIRPVTQGPSYLPVVDCVVSEWSDWGPCSAAEPCTKGMQYKERHIITHPSNGGKACPRKLRKSKRCRVPCSESKRRNNNAVDCKMGPWSNWSPCSNICGSSAVQQRTRTIERYPSNGGKECGPRLEERRCALPYACTDREFLNAIKF